MWPREPTGALGSLPSPGILLSALAPPGLLDYCMSERTIMPVAPFGV